MKSTKKIHSITVKRMIDTDPDTSWLGEYSNKAESEYAIDRAHSEDCQSVQPTNEATTDTLVHAADYLANTPYVETYTDAIDEAIRILDEARESLEDCDCSHHYDNRSYRYFNPNYANYKGLEDSEIRKYCRQDFERMEALNNDDWCFIGIRAEAEYSIGNVHGHSLMQELSSGGLWGIESDSDADYFESVEAEELSNLRTQLEGIGFGKRAIATAFKHIEHKED